MSKTLAKKFLEFAEEIQDPDYDTSVLESDFEDSDIMNEPEVESVSDTEATISMPPADGDEGSAVTVVTPKGTSVTVTESMAKALASSKWFKLISEALKPEPHEDKKVNESAGGANIAFSTADVNAFQSGATLDDIIERRIAKTWNDPQGIKNAFGGSVNEEMEEDGDSFFGDEEEEAPLEEVENQPITANLSVEDDKIVIDNIELKDEVEENPSLDAPTAEDEEEEAIGDPIGEALQKAKELKKDATFTGDVNDAEKPALRVQTTNGVIDKKKVQEQPESK